MKKSLVLLLLVASSSAPTSEASLKGARLDVVVPAIPAPSTQFSDGRKPVKLDSFRGKYVVANFWATWCAPCIQEMPSLDRLAARVEKKGIVVVAISQDEGGATQVRPFLENLKLLKLRILYDPNKASYRDYALRGLPTTVVISPSGDVVARLEGGANWDAESMLEQLTKLSSKQK